MPPLPPMSLSSLAIRVTRQSASVGDALEQRARVFAFDPQPQLERRRSCMEGAQSTRESGRQLKALAEFTLEGNRLVERVTEHGRLRDERGLLAKQLGDDGAAQPARHCREGAVRAARAEHAGEAARLCAGEGGVRRARLPEQRERREQHPLDALLEKGGVEAQHARHVRVHPLGLVTTVGLSPSLEMVTEALEQRRQQRIHRPERILAHRVAIAGGDLGASAARVANVFQQQQLAHRRPKLAQRLRRGRVRTRPVVRHLSSQPGLLSSPGQPSSESALTRRPAMATRSSGSSARMRASSKAGKVPAATAPSPDSELPPRIAPPPRRRCLHLDPNNRPPNDCQQSLARMRGACADVAEHAQPPT